MALNGLNGFAACQFPRPRVKVALGPYEISAKFRVARKNRPKPRLLDKSYLIRQHHSQMRANALDSISWAELQIYTNHVIAEFWEFVKKKFSN